MTELENACVYEVKFVNLIPTFRVVAPTDASLDDVAAAGRLAFLAREIAGVREEHVEHDTEHAHKRAAVHEVESVTRIEQVTLSPVYASLKGASGV